MINKFLKNNRKIFTGITLAAVIFILWGNIAEASVAGTAISWLFGGFSSTVLPIMNVILWIGQTFLAFILSLSAHLLNQAFTSNITTNPADWAVVRQGWSISRDMVNSLFILIVLWIAFTIILGREEYGGKKLLARVFILALVINFSLVMVSAVFGFSNAFANIFAKQIPEDVAGFIVNAIKAQTVLGMGEDGTGSSAGGGTAFQQQAEEEAIAMKFNPQKNEWGLKQTFLASLGFNPATAFFGGGFTSGAEGEAKTTQPKADPSSPRNAALDTVNKDQPSWPARNVNDFIKLAAGNLFLALTITAILVGAITLWMRILYMILLSIVAPLALLSQAVPIKKAQGYFSQWAGLLFNWAFFAPGFYFLFYLSLFMLQTFDKLGQGSAAQSFAYLDFNKVIQLLLALGLMLMSVKFAKKTGGALADMAISGLTKVASGIATGGASLAAAGAAGAAGAAARAGAPQVTKAAEWLAGRPVLGKLAAPVTRRVAGYVEEQQKVVEKKREGLKGQSDDMLIQHIRTSILAQDKIAAVLEMIGRKDGALKLKQAGFNFDDLAKMGARFGAKTSDTIRDAKYGNVVQGDFEGKANETVMAKVLDKNAKAIDRVAAFLNQANKRPGQLSKAIDNGLNPREILQLATTLNDKTVEAVLQAMPHMADPSLGPEFTLDKIAGKIKPDEMNVQYDGIIKAMTAERKSPTEIANTLQRILQAITLNNGTTERFGKMLQNLQGQPKDARNAVMTQIQVMLNNQPFWQNMETSDPESFKRHVQYFVGNAIRRSPLQVPQHIKDAARKYGIKAGGGGGGGTP